MPTREDIRSFAEHARTLVDNEVTLRFGKSASELNRLAEVLRTAGARLDGTFTAPYFDRAAQQIDRAADLIKHASIQELAGSAQRLARSSPWLYIGGALAVGLGAGRFLRSSAALALPSDASASTRAPSSARAATRKQRQPSFTTTRDES
jgi:ElaB/YqjD/DUF883 family membrane-anchored ribosome-binding protein